MRRMLLSAATLAGIVLRRKTSLFLIELGGLLCICAGIAAFSPPVAVIMFGVAVIVAVEVRA